MSRKRGAYYRGRMPSAASRPADKERTTYKPDGTLVAEQTLNGYTKAERVTGDTAAAVAAAIGLVPGGRIEQRNTARVTPYTGYSEQHDYTTSAPPAGLSAVELVLYTAPGIGALLSFEAPCTEVRGATLPPRITPDAAHKPDAMLSAGHWTYTVELVPSQALAPDMVKRGDTWVSDPNRATLRDRHQHKRYIRGSAAGREELADIVDYYGLRCTEQHRKQRLDGTWFGGSTTYTLHSVGVTEEALGMLCRMEHVRTIHRQWVAETGGSNTYVPPPAELRKKRMQLRDRRYVDLRKQFGVQERGFWKQGDGDRAGHWQYIASRTK